MSDKYEKERGIPQVPMCMQSPISLRFDGASLRITGAHGHNLITSFRAVSGKPIKDKGFDYSIERQKISGQGPIPAGNYWIKPSEIWENSTFRSLHPSNRYAGWGAYRITIHPYPSTETYGRGGFFIHGGTVPGSQGCIDLTTSIVSFIQQLDELLKGRPECHIPVYVRY
ncbi:MAG: DUF2778 domain-containing protein [Azoarcus sp.]|jgi:hypothetical protein|nr:DUF2778 domain-containing protein [Azoarcus sp.]